MTKPKRRYQANAEPTADEMRKQAADDPFLRDAMKLGTMSNNDIYETYFEDRVVRDGGWAMPRDWRHTVLLHTVRDLFVQRFSFAIPCREAIGWIRETARAHTQLRVLDPMAGSGYWAKLLEEAGCSVKASDAKTWGVERGMRMTFSWFTEPFFRVAKFDAEKRIEQDDGQSLVLLCWPPMESISSKCLLAMKPGQPLAYIGEGAGGCTGDEKMHQILEEDFAPLESGEAKLQSHVDIPQFYGIRDGLHFFRKKS